MKPAKLPKTGGNRQGVPDKFKPFRDRPVQCRVVACPTCGAEVGAPCKKRDGSPGTNIHHKRRGLAIQRELALAEQQMGEQL